MPNTPALLGAGATGLFANARVTPAQQSSADTLLKAAGMTVWIDDEAHMDIVTALSGSGPAYVFFLAEAMQAAAEAQGLPTAVASALTRQTIFGAMRLLEESGQTPSELRRQVTTPAGTTHAAITALTNDGFQQLLNRAIAAATERGRELSALHDQPDLFCRSGSSRDRRRTT